MTSNYKERLNIIFYQGNFYGALNFKKGKHTYSTGKKQSSLLTSLYSQKGLKNTHFLGHKTVPKVFPYKITSQSNSPGLTQRHILTYISMN